MISTATPKKKFDLQEYHHLIDTGIFHEDKKVELIEGELFEMSPVGFRHASCVNKLNYIFSLKLGEKAIVSIQNPIKLNNKSEPQPDIVLLKPRDDFYATQHPTPEDILLLIEVADSSIEYDRTIKLPSYAENKIIETWLIDLNNNFLEKHTNPKTNYYQKREKLSREDIVFSDSFSDIQIAVKDIINH